MRCLRWLRVQLRRQGWLQLLLLCLIWAACDQVVRHGKLPIPAGVLGLGGLLLALELRLLSVRWFRRGAALLLAHLILFFVPAMLAVVNHPELLSALGLKLLSAVLLGTVLVIAGTATVVELAFRLEAARAR